MPAVWWERMQVKRPSCHDVVTRLLRGWHGEVDVATSRDMVRRLNQSLGLSMSWSKTAASSRPALAVCLSRVLNPQGLPTGPRCMANCRVPLASTEPLI